MAVKSMKPISFDAVAKFFIQKYDIPTRKDINRLFTKIEQLEKIIKKSIQAPNKNKPFKVDATLSGSKGTKKQNQTASDTVLEIVTKSKEGIDFAEIKSKSGFADKKLRNIIFRLNKIGKIKRKHRGIYIVT